MNTLYFHIINHFILTFFCWFSFTVQQMNNLTIIINKIRMPLDLTATEAELALFSRLNNYVSLNQIPLTSFWRTSRLCLTLQEFLQLLTHIDFKIHHQELQNLASDNVEFVNLAALIEGVQYWKNLTQSVSNFISEQQQIQQHQPVQSNKQKTPRDSKFQMRLKTATSRSTHTAQSKPNRQLEAEVKLSHTLHKTKNQSDYELTIKVGQANDICKQLQNQYSFLIDASEGETKIIEINSKTGEERVIKVRNFEKKYEQFKAASLSRGQQIEGTLEQDLKKTLVEVMCLSDHLQEQIRLLEVKGVAH